VYFPPYAAEERPILHGWLLELDTSQFTFLPTVCSRRKANTSWLAARTGYFPAYFPPYAAEERPILHGWLLELDTSLCTFLPMQQKKGQYFMAGC